MVVGDFNSSDLEDEPDDEPQPIKKRGVASLESMKESSLEDRKTSKLLDRKRVLNCNTPTTQACLDLHAQRFEFFRTTTLNAQPGEKPTAEQMRRYLLMIPKHMKAHGNDIVHVTSLTSALSCITKYCTFKYEGFKLDPHERVGLNSGITGMLNNGTLTNKRKRTEPSWVTWEVIHYMTVAILGSGIVDGTADWDISLAKVLFLCLQCALATRAGDVLKSKLYDSTNCLLYGDITIRLLTDGNEERLHASFKLHNLKGHKLDPNHNKLVEVSEIGDPQYNACCPVKLIYIVALRVGAVAQSSWGEFISHLRATRSHTVTWTKPDYPLFHAELASIERRLQTPPISGLDREHSP
ncbi:hypothetical protein QQX98_007921 [Neonectria punicea]|uniref:HNH nuclease domain-containing protein n=1 Tax=Neonectria punicea TaxID=979145 RepID=A0ABR1GWS4_9HYPO